MAGVTTRRPARRLSAGGLQPRLARHTARYHLKEAEKLLADLADAEQLAELFGTYDAYNRQLPSTGP
jgi:hypothetical protein